VGKEGFWRVGYRNEFGGGGWALIVLDTGQIVGVDAWGGTWDGTYEYDPRNNNITMRLTVALSPEAVSTVTGRSSPTGHTETCPPFTVPNDLGAEAPFALTIQGVHFAALFKKIRDFPQ
jgi:hypothetical protein